MFTYTGTYTHTHTRTVDMVLYEIIGWILSQRAFSISLFQVQHLKALIDLIRALRPVRDPEAKLQGSLLIFFVVPSLVDR